MSNHALLTSRFASRRTPVWPSGSDRGYTLDTLSETWRKRWDIPAASSVEGGAFQGGYPNAAPASLPVDAFSYHFAGLDEEADFFSEPLDEPLIDEPVRYNTASPWHPTSSPDESFNNPMEFSTAGLSLPPAPYPSGNTIPLFN
ncbi:hypothetical protein CEP52_004227 [Fusarium oligoseptatum]|uniref:Uncharacterized protein n=1 Tax=Fusarium oligoseptatum TaxID=2604345 RepID=A0A428U555_9HYPO|nr:hypothetical protein CEP52_004227 [Fusarium oligoseptatum]